MNKPLVSIILPVYNQSHLISRAIHSVLKQTSPNWELIIVNDGSTDQIFNTVIKFLHNKKIKYFSLPHQGMAKTIDFGFIQTCNDFITTIDADDYYKPQHLQENINYIMQNPQADLVMSKAEIIGDKYVVDLEKHGRLIHLDHCSIGGTFFIKKHVFQAVGGHSSTTQYGADYFLLQKIKKAGFFIHSINSRTYVYDRTSQNTITKNKEQQIKAQQI